MTLNTISQVIQLLKSWSLAHYADIMEIILVGSQSKLRDCDSLRQDSDFDIIVVIQDTSNVEAVLSDLVAIAVKESIFFHPLIMTKSELKEKLEILHYRTMLASGRRIFPQ